MNIVYNLKMFHVKHYKKIEGEIPSIYYKLFNIYFFKLLKLIKLVK